MDTDALRLFVLAAEKRNISSAGRDLGLAPAVASAWLAKLEKTIGASLLRRSTRKVSLSLEGAEFLPYARDIIAREDAGRAALGQGSALVSGTLRFTAPSTFAQTYIVPILPKFLAAHPNLTLDLRLSDKQLDLIEGSFDLALRNAAMKDSSLRGRKLADDIRILCASPEYLFNHGTPTKPDELAKHDILAFGNAASRPLTSASSKDALFPPTGAKIKLINDDGRSHRLATLAGLGVAANSRWSVHEDLKTGRLVQVLRDYHLGDDTALWLLYPQANTMSAKLRVFMDFLLTEIGRHPPWLRHSPT